MSNFEDFGDELNASDMELGDDVDGQLDNETIQLRLKNEQLEIENKELRNLIEVKNKTIRNLQKQLLCKKSSTQSENPKHHSLLRKFFTDGQIRMLCDDSKKWIHWNDVDISRALTLYSISKKSYTFLRDTWNYPSPSVSTLKRWLQEVSILPGKIMTPVLDVMKAEFFGKSEMERVCVLALDEIGINKKYVYDKSQDKIYGGKDCVPVITARGLFTSWKQVLYYDLENKTDIRHINNIIKALHGIGLIVVAFVSDLGTKNQGLWKEFGVGKVTNGEIGEISFRHPCEDRKIYVFGDFPHLIKLLRNHLLDNGIKLPDGTVLDKSLLEKLLKVQDSEFRLTHKLSHKHVYLKGKQRQNVACAFQVFSQKTATAIRFLTYGHVVEANFIELVNDCADLMNSRISTEVENDYKCPYGMKKERQDELLDCVTTWFTNLRVGDRRSYAPFQKAWIMNIRSLRELFDDMHGRYNTNYILTARLNQDYLENLFSQIRGINGFKNNPDALEFMYRMKSIVCNSNLNSPTTGSVQPDAEESAMLSSKVLRTLMTNTPVVNPSSVGMNETQREQLDQFDWEIELIELRAENLTMSQRAESGGMEYCAGFLAQKFRNDYPQLSTRGLGESRSPFWVDFLTQGGLSEPSSFWYSAVRKFEEVFAIMHPDLTVDKEEKVVKRFYALLRPCYEELVPEVVLKTYAKFRTLLRIRYLNLQIEDKAHIASEMKRRAFSNMARDSIQVESEEEPHDPTQADLDLLEQLIGSYQSRP